MTVTSDILKYLSTIKAGVAKQPTGYPDHAAALLEALYAGMLAGNPEREWDRVGKAILFQFPDLGVETWDDVPAPRKYIYARSEFNAIEPPPPALKTADGKHTILIGKGQILIYAPTRSFKSFIALRWANQLAALDKRVLFCIGERFDAFSSRSRAHDSYYPKDVNDRLDFADVLAMHMDGTDVRMIGGLEPAYDVVFIDTFRSAINPEDENSNADIGDWLRKLRLIAHLVVIVHHTNKGGEDYAGAGAFATNTDTEIKVAKVDGVKLLRRVSIELNDDESLDDLHYRLVPHGQSLVAVELDAEQVAHIKARVAAGKLEQHRLEKDEKFLRALKAGPLTKPELAEDTGVGEKTVHRWLQDAMKRRIVAEDDNKDGRKKRYRLTYAGETKTE